MSTVSEWSAPPQMDTGAPMPGVCATGAEVYLAYVIRSPKAEKQEMFAIVKFAEVRQHIFGYPNDEALGGHPLYKLGLAFYAFNVIEDSPYVRELDRRNAVVFPESSGSGETLTHWIVTFHDETLEVIGQSAEVVGRVEAESAHAAIGLHLRSQI